MAAAPAEIEATPAAEEELELEDFAPEFVTVDRLQECGVNAADVKKLKDAGIATVGGVLQQAVRKLLAIKGLSEAKVEKVREAARKLSGGSRFATAADALVRRRSVIPITTGSKELDSILGGGIETGSLTEVFGEFRTGKTQLIHTMCVTCQLGRDQGGGAGKVIVVDTEGSFRPERVAEIAEKRYGLNPDEVLDNVRIARVFNVDDQCETNLAIAAMLADDEAPTRLVIVDSATALWRQDYTGRGELAERQQRLNGYLADLKRICEEYNVAVLLSNQVTANPDSSMFAGADKKPIGGHIIAHASTTRLYFRKGKGDQRIVKIYDSPSRPELEAVFAITEQGVVDAE